MTIRESNLRHWDALSHTDPKYTKPFKRPGGFEGVAITPMWTEMRLTEAFGPCGIGWGMDKPEFTLITVGEELIVYCTVRCWYRDKDAQSEPAFVWGVGGDKVAAKTKYGIQTDDEAFKKSLTDAIGNAFKHVGSGADVRMGLYDDSRYVNYVKAEFSPPEPVTVQQKAHDEDVQRKQRKLSDHPDAPKARDAHMRITKALGRAETADLIDEIIKVNASDIELIRLVHEESATALLALVDRLKADMRRHHDQEQIRLVHTSERAP